MTGAKTVGSLAEFSQTGDVNQLEKTPLAAAAAKDVAHSAKQSVVAAVQAGKTVVQAATLSDGGIQEIGAATQDYKDLDCPRGPALPQGRATERFPRDVMPPN